MKISLTALFAIPALGAALLLSSCAVGGAKIAHTDVATGATNPKAIYIQPFDITYCDFIGEHAGGPGEEPIRRSLAPAEFANDLKIELAKMAPCMVLKPGDKPRVGWLVTGSFQVIDAGSPKERVGLFTSSAGQSHVKLHVRIYDLDAKKAALDPKDRNADRELYAGRGNIIYEFDVEGGSGESGQYGSITAPGEGYSMPFDFKNASQRIYMALAPDVQHYGDRTALMVR